VRRNDNCPVTIASHYFTVTPVSKTERRVKDEHRRAVEQPHVVKMYNQGMRGMDIGDRMLSSYRPRMRSRKWWWNLFNNSLNIYVMAAVAFTAMPITLRPLISNFAEKLQGTVFGKSRSNALFGWPYSPTQRNSKIRRRETYTEICLIRKMCFLPKKTLGLSLM